MIEIVVNQMVILLPLFDRDITQKVYGHWLTDLAKKQKLHDDMNSINF